MTTTAVPLQALAMTPDEVAVAFFDMTNELSNEYIERRPALEVLVTGVLAKSHTFLLGPPGTAKSTLIRALCDRITGARFARLLLDKQLPKDEGFGEIDIAKYEAGHGWERDYEGTVVDAHLAFLDEVGKAGPAVLNAMLTWMEEREHKPGKVWLESPTLSIIGASNELLDMTEGLAAIWDRFLLRYKVDYIEEPANFGRLLRSKVRTLGASATSVTSGSFTTVDLPSLEHVINNVVPYIPVGDDAINSLIGLRSTLAAADIIPSDRRWASSVRLIQASAFLNRRPEVDPDDLLILRHVLWDDEGQVDEVRKQVMKLGSPTIKAAAKMQEILDQLDVDLSSHAGLAKRQKNLFGVDAQATTNRLRDQLNAEYAIARKANRSTAPLDGVKAQLINQRFRLYTEYLGTSEEGALAAAGADLS